MKKFLLFILILIFNISYGEERVLNQKKIHVFGRVNQQFNIILTPQFLQLHEVGYKILYSREYALLHITSNSAYTVYFSTKGPGDIYKGDKYLQTYYMVLPFNAPTPSNNDRRWMDSVRFNNYFETPTDYADYKRKIYIKAIKNFPPYGSKEYEEEIVIRIVDINGNNQITGLKIYLK